MSPRTSLRILERIGRMAAIAALPFLLAASASAGTFYSQGSLDATALPSWNSVRAGGGTAPVDFASGDVFVVQDTHTMTLGGAWTISGAGSELQVESGGTLVVSSGQALAVGGPVTSSGTLDVQGALRLEEGGSLTLPAGTLALDAASGVLEVGGDWTVGAGATFTPNGRAVRLNGTADQSVTSGGDAFAGLTISKSGGKVTLADDLAVEGVLELASGNLETGAAVLVIGSAGSVSRTNGHVVGQLRKTLDPGTSSRTFEIGDASNYAPVQVTGQGGGFNSAFVLTASTAAGDHASLATSGIASDRSVNRTYTLTAAGYTGGPFALVCDFVAGDLDAGATPSRFVIRRHASGAWTPTSTGTRTATTTSATGLTAFGDFAVGEQAIDHYEVAATSPQFAGSVFTTTVTARDVLEEPVVDDHTTSVTMTSSGAAEFDADGNATFGDNAGTLAAGTFGIATRDATAETVTLTATDANSRTGSRAGLVVQAALSIATTSLPNGTAGDAYSQALAATGGAAPYGGWTVTAGVLPAGLALDGGTGVISGTPTTAETQAFTVQVSDAASHTATQALSLTVGAGAAAQLAVVQTPANTVAGVVLSPHFSVRLRDAFGNDVPAAGVTVEVALTTGPGPLSGTVSRPTDATGLAVFDDLVLQAAGAAQQLTASSTGLTPAAGTTFDVLPAAAASLVFVQQPTSALVGATITPAVTLRVRDAFGNDVPGEPVSIELVGTGTLSGDAPANTGPGGIATFAALSVNHVGAANILEASAGGLGPVSSDLFDITCPVLALDPVALPNGTQGSAYAQAIAASGGTAPYGYAVTAGSLPAGLSLAGTGELTGTPTATGTSNFTVTATDAFGCTGARAYSLQVDSSCPAITVLPAALPPGSVSVPYAQSLTAGGGVAPYTFAVTAGALPAGLSLSAAGSLSGTPTTSGTFTFTAGVTDAGLCPGSREFALEVRAVPAAIADLAAQCVLAGNDADGTAKLAITFTAPPGSATVEVYRAGFGGYPRYDNAGGSVPALPSYPPGPPWTLTAVGTSGQVDEPATRDFWYYVAFAKNGAGGTSAVSNRSAGALDYHLGDVSDGFTVGQGNNFVGNEDVSLLGANYGIVEPELTSRGVHYLDVGPTTDLLLTSRPFTDGRIDFEDFIVFATNFFVVSTPQLATTPVADGPGAADELRIEAPAAVEAGQVVAARLWIRGSGGVQGFSAGLGWDASVVEPLAVAPAGWLQAQGGMVLSPRAGVVDAALLGVGGRGMTGEGEVATVTFRALRAGAPGIRIARVTARDGRNRPAELGATALATGTPRVWTTALASPWPNPARGLATLEFSLAQASRVDLAVFSVDGRRVKTLARGDREAGAWRAIWDGSDESGRTAAAGLYYAQLQAGDRRFTRRLVLLR